MRYYTIDELNSEDTAKAAQALCELGYASGLEGLCWLPVPADLLSPVQQEHAKSCGPHVLSLEVTPDSLRLELLVRARGCLRCDCVAYAEPRLRQTMMDWLDTFVADLGIAV